MEDFNPEMHFRLGVFISFLSLFWGLVLVGVCLCVVELIAALTDD